MAVKVTAEQYLESLRRLFLEKVKQSDAGTVHQTDDDGARMYWKWIFTQKIADDLGVSDARVRRNLHLLEKQGLVVTDKKPVCYGWCAKEVDGFIDTRFKDYRTRVKSEPNGVGGVSQTRLPTSNFLVFTIQENPQRIDVCKEFAPPYLEAVCDVYHPEEGWMKWRIVGYTEQQVDKLRWQITKIVSRFSTVKGEFSFTEK